eukprot:3690950-Amphidinium_carterae.3
MHPEKAKLTCSQVNISSSQPQVNFSTAGQLQLVNIKATNIKSTSQHQGPYNYMKQSHSLSAKDLVHMHESRHKYLFSTMRPGRTLAKKSYSSCGSVSSTHEPLNLLLSPAPTALWTSCLH